jgi:hypothetical protein
MRRFVAALLLLAACAGPEPSPEPAQASPTAPEVVEPSPEPEVCADPFGCYGDPELVGEFDAALVPGASGLAAGVRNPGVLYLLDDRPHTSEVWVARSDGTMLGAIEVAGLDALDTESLAIGPCGAANPAPCLYIGDIGDNLRARADITVHRFAEPDLTAGLPEEPVDAEVIRLRYPDGPHDAEALLVDDGGVPHIVTKAPFDRATGRTGETRLYRATGFADGVLADLGVLGVPEPATPLHSQVVGNVVTGGEHRDGRVLLRTYDQVLEYVAPGPAADLAELDTWHVRAVPSPFEPQSEAITWAPDGCGYYTVSEMVGDIWFVPCVHWETAEEGLDWGAHAR